MVHYSQRKRSNGKKRQRSSHVRIAVRKDKHVGTLDKPYKADSPSSVRAEALLAGIRAREKMFGKDGAIVDVKKRLSALRTLNRSNAIIRSIMTEDMRRLDKLRGSGVTSSIGGKKSRKKDRRRINQRMALAHR